MIKSFADKATAAIFAGELVRRLSHDIQGIARSTAQGHSNTILFDYGKKFGWDRICFNVLIIFNNIKI